MKGYLLDTNVVSESLKKAPDRHVMDWMKSVRDDLLYLSVITLGEIRKGIELQQNASCRAELEIWLHTKIRAEFEGKILDVNQEVADRWGTFTAQARQRGNPLPQVDALLAATAFHHNMTLVTRNDKHFANTMVTVFNPWWP
jgi:predicted nucleic acid-binding protein